MWVETKFKKAGEAYLFYFKHPVLTRGDWQKGTVKERGFETDLHLVKTDSGVWKIKGLPGGERYAAKTRGGVALSFLEEKWSSLAEDLAVPSEAYRKNKRRARGKRRLSKPVANTIYDILVKECGAADHADGMNRSYFLYHHCEDISEPERNRCEEYRFGGKLGSGGKFHNEQHRFRVSAYPDTPADVKLMVAKANVELQDLYRATYGG